MTDVTIPQDVAKRHAETLRQYRGGGMTYGEAERIADLLDPPPSPSLRDVVIALLDGDIRHEAANFIGAIADELLAVVADWLEAQPFGGVQRAHDVRLIRGEAS